MPRAAAGSRVLSLLAHTPCAVGLAACTRSPPAAPVPAEATASIAASSSAPDADSLAPLRDFENTARAHTDFAQAPSAATALGSDPYVVRYAGVATPPGQERLVGLLRSRNVLVELDGALHEVARVAAPLSPVGLAVAGDGDVFVVGEFESRIARYRRSHGLLRAAGSIDLPGVRAMRDIAAGPEGLLYVVEEHDGRLLTIRPGRRDANAAPLERAEDEICHGPLRVLRVGPAVLVDCLLDHEIAIRRVDERGFPMRDGEVRIRHDGPMWALDALQEGPGMLVAVGGVEDHPLDRTEGSFGFVDSFVTLYGVEDGRARKLGEVNTSEAGVVTPKAIRLARRASGALELTVAAYGSDRVATLVWEDAAANALPGAPAIATRAVPPGSASLARLPDDSLAIANPLLDAWIRVTPDRVSIVRPEDSALDTRSSDARLGEALFFTTLMAPWNRSEGRLSRFTCETCHFEGYVDGRTHYTGRGAVYATTKPLLGLFNDRPYFSRALDPDMTTMVNNEFRVAGARSDHDPWFTLSASDFPWTRDIAVADDAMSPLALRRALMTFFMSFGHRPNPAVVGRVRWSDVERAGAGVFRDRCESCHQARLVADDPATRVPFEQWESLVMSPEGPLVWARAEYAKTGVVPYVNDKGARVVSLRRLYKKFPYFTNGSAKSIGAVLDRARVTGDGFQHDGADGGDALSDDEKQRLAAFLDLL